MLTPKTARYPSILVRLDEEKGIDWLLEYYSKENSKLICQAICRVTGNKVSTEKLLKMFSDEKEAIRILAAELAGWATLNKSIDVAVVEALEDKSEQVITSAISAKQRRRDRRITKRLSSLVVSESDPMEQAIYFDALIGQADPGLTGRYLCHELKKAFAIVSPFEVKAAFEILKKRRKGLHDKLKK